MSETKESGEGGEKKYRKRKKKLKNESQCRKRVRVSFKICVGCHVLPDGSTVTRKQFLKELIELVA